MTALLRPADEWWEDVAGTCTMIRLFCTRDHVEQWSDRHAPDEGDIAARTVWNLAQVWYGDRLDDDFQAHTRWHNHALLTERGLTGAFWQLPRRHCAIRAGPCGRDRTGRSRAGLPRRNLQAR